MRRAWLGLAVALLAQASCGEERVRACTQIGCYESLAVVQLDGLPRGRVEVRICADGRCHAATFDERGPQAFVPLDHELADRSRLVVEVRRRGRVISRGAADVPVETSRPNGPHCPPVCRRAGARLDLATDRLEPS